MKGFSYDPMTAMTTMTTITTMTTNYLSATKTIVLKRHHNLPNLMNYKQASYTHKVRFVKTHNLFFNIFRIIIINIVLNILLFQIYFV